MDIYFTYFFCLIQLKSVPIIEGTVVQVPARHVV